MASHDRRGLAWLEREFASCDDRFLADVGLTRDEAGHLRRSTSVEPTDPTSEKIENQRGIEWLGSRLREIDRVILAIVAVSAAVAILDSEQFFPAIRFTLLSLWSVAAYLLLSSVFVATLAATGADQLMAHAFGGHPIRAIIVASAAGAALPLCSASVIPIIVALLIAGAPFAPIMAFWIASPLMDPETFLLTVGILGLPWAIARLTLAIMLGILAGLTTLALPANWFFNISNGALVGSVTCGPWAIASCGEKSSAGVEWRFWTDRNRRLAFWRQGSALLWFLSKWLGLAFLLESLLMAYVPTDGVLAVVGGDKWWAIPLSAVVGIPIYLNGFSALPVIKGLLLKGMMPGAAMAFLIAGEITSLPTAIAVFAIVRRGIFAWYLLLGVIGAIIAGFAVEMAGPSVGL